MHQIYRPSEDEVMRRMKQSLRDRMNREQGSRLTSAFGDLDFGPPPAGFEKPAYGTPAYAIALKAGWIGAEEEQGDRAAYEERRQRSLQTCHRYTLYERRQHARPAETGAYVPELSARLEADRNLTDGARRLARKLAEIIYRQNRAGRFTEITVTYLMEALHRSRRTVQRYLRLLEREGYINTQVIRGTRSRMCTGLAIALCKQLLASHHQERWPAKRETPGASKESQNKRFLDSIGSRERLSVRRWSLLCMDGVFRAFMKTDPLGLMKISPPLPA